jgi:hypothetical protein
VLGFAGGAGGGDGGGAASRHRKCNSELPCSTAQRCGVDQHQPAQRIFANPDRKHGWREYPSVKDVPELENDAGESAFLWTGHNGFILVSTQEPGEDFAAYTRLANLSNSGSNSALRGDGAIERKVQFGRDCWCRKHRSSSTQRPTDIAKPEQAADITDALKPRLYLRESQLPFQRLLTKNQ